jgi:hypothetical protein
MILKQKEGQKKTDIIVPDDTNIYRINHPLAQTILDECKQKSTPTRKITFKYNPKEKITALRDLIGQTGWLQINLLEINSFEVEQHLLFACISDEGEQIAPDDAKRLFSLLATENETIEMPQNVMESCQNIIKKEKAEIITQNDTRSGEFFETEIDKLEQWAKDMEISLDKEIKDLVAEIKLKKIEARNAKLLDEKVKLQRIVKELDKKRKEKVASIYAAQTQIEEDKDVLISETEAKLKQTITQTNIFSIQWEIV